VRAAREKAVATRKDALTGTSEYPILAEVEAKVLDVAPVKTAPLAAKVLSAEPMPPMRLAEPYEALRDASDRHLAKTGARPKVFLANLGTLAESMARATFVQNFFAAGGIEAVPHDGSGDLAAAFQASGAKLACLCSTDEVYGREGPEAAKALAAGARHIYLAGKPGDQIDALTQAGVGTFVATGSDAFATLRAAYDILGIAR
jgi:methylmalonyl-CoA mutase